MVTWLAGFASGVNYDWMQEFSAEATGLAATFKPAVIGFAAVLDNLDAEDAKPSLIVVTNAGLTRANVYLQQRTDVPPAAVSWTSVQSAIIGGGGTGAPPFAIIGGGGTGAPPFAIIGGGGTGAPPFAIITAPLFWAATTVFRLMAPARTSMARRREVSLRDIECLQGSRNPGALYT